MAAPKFVDLCKKAKDLFKDDYTTSTVAKIKYYVPDDVHDVFPFEQVFGTQSSITSETEYKDRKLEGKLVMKWKHSSGFALDKLQIKPDATSVTETSLSGVAPGLKFNFKGDDKDLGVLGVDYSIPNFAFTSELDVVDYKFFKATGLTGYNGLLGGGGLTCDTKSYKLKSYNYGFGYQGPNYFAGALSADDKKYEGYLLYSPSKEISLGASAEYSTEKSKTKTTLGGSHKCTPSTLYRAKVDTDFGVAAAIVHEYSKGVSVTASVDTKLNELKSAKFGWCLSLA